MADLIQWSPYALPALGATLFCVGSFLYVWPRRRARGAASFLLLCISAVWWVFLQAASALLTDDAHKVLSAQVQYLGIATCPGLLFYFAIDFNGLLQRHRRMLAVLLSVQPLGMLAAVFTNSRHELVWRGFEFAESFPIRISSYGPLFDLHIAYSYALVLLACAVGLWRFSQTPGWWRQSALVTLAPMIVLGFNLLHLTGNSPFWGLDPSPIGISLGMAVVAFAVFRFRAFELPPITRTDIYDQLDAAILTIDGDDQLLDSNLGAHRLFNFGASFGTPIESMLPKNLWREIRDLSDADLGEAIAPLEVGERVLEGQMHRMTEEPGKGIRVLVFRDVTARHRAEQQLARTRDELARANEELARQAHTDRLTGLANRRRLIEVIDQEVVRARRYRSAGDDLGLIVFDIDLFKRVNDTHGHDVGDLVLQATTRAVSAALRDSDLLARLGGEEFVVVAPGVSIPGLNRLAERIRSTVATTVIAAGPQNVQVTVSCGGALLREVDSTGPGESSDAPVREIRQRLLSLADERLYRAKDTGRNCAVTTPMDNTTFFAPNLLRRRVGG